MAERVGLIMLAAGPEVTRQSGAAARDAGQLARRLLAHHETAVSPDVVAG